MKLVKVTWNDSTETSDSGWVSLDSAKKDRPCKIASVGWLINETDEFITIAGDVDANEIESEKDDLLGRVECIPRGCIVKIEILSVGLIF
jgi:hypothetical protein|tara:strand:+ start:76 stop:345 length:270 start_codon:yes stop_codon:yes gene_type:complete